MKRRRDGASHLRPCRSMRAGTALCVGVQWWCATSAVGAAAAGAANETSDEPFTLTAESGLKWVRAMDNREGHAAACLRHGLDPTPPEILLSEQMLPPWEAPAAPHQEDGGSHDGTTSERGNSSATKTPPRPLWSEAVLTLVADGFGLDLERPGGMAGCCVPGMWCGPRGCYTLAFGDAFYNHGGYVGIPPDEYSIFTCTEPSVPLAAPSNSTAASSASDAWSTDSGYAPVQPSGDSVNGDDNEEDGNSTSSSSSSSSSRSSSSGRSSTGTAASIDGDLGIGNGDGNGTDTAGATIDVADNSSSSSSNGSNSSIAVLPTSPPTQAPTERQTPAGDASDGSPPPPVRPTVVGVSPEMVTAGEALMLVGTGFGEAVEDVRVMVGGRDCRDPELCHLVCRPCGDEDRCEFDEMCMEDGLSKEKVCLPICDGTEGSCPCDHRCLPKRFELQGEPHSMVVNLCRPPDADPNFLCHGSVLREQERIQCTVPVLVWDQAETESSPRAGVGVGRASGHRGRGLDDEGGQSAADGSVTGVEQGGEEGGGGEGQAGEGLPSASVSLSVANRGATWDEGVAFAPRECGSAEDCDDGDACSFDACLEGFCVHTGVQEGYGCQAQPADVMWRGDAYRYFQIVDQADPVEQAEFVSAVEALNKLSSVTSADDYPVEFHNWVDFPVYGTKYEDIYISPNGALFVPPLQTVVPGGLSAVSPSTEAFFSVLKADWNPSDSRASSSVLVMVDDDQFSVLYKDVFLFKRSASATPSTFSTTVFPDGSLRYRYIRIGDKADWTVGVSGNSFVSPTIRDRHVVQSEFIQINEDGLPVAATAVTAAAAPQASPGDPTAGTSASGSNTSEADTAAAVGGGNGDGSNGEGQGASSGVTIVASDNGGGAEGGGVSEGDGEGGVGTEVTLCRAPTLACLGRACGKAGSEIPVLWEGFGCSAAASLNMTFSCRVGGLEVPAISLEDFPGSSAAEDGFEWIGGEEKEAAWGPDWIGPGGEERAAGGGLACTVPRLEWVETGQEQSVMVPVEVLWSLPPQASASAQQQVILGASDVGVRGMSVIGDSGVVNSHVLAFRYYRDDGDAPDCGCSPASRETDLTCDSCLVCGGDDSTKDCGGFCHGEAYISPCGDCSGGMTGVAGGLWCEEYREYLDGPAEAALLSLSQSIMMLVALSIMTAFLTTCLFLARALMLRGVLAVERDRHGTLRRRVFSRHRGLSPSELEYLETFEYSTAGTAVSEDAGDEDSSYADGSGGIELCRDDRAVSCGGVGVAADEGFRDQAEAGEDEEDGALGSGVTETACLLDCAICLAGLEDGDVLRKLPCRHFFHRECVDEWLHLSVSCPLCKRSARDGIRRHRRRRRRAREAAQTSSRRDGAISGASEAALVHATAAATTTPRIHSGLDGVRLGERQSSSFARLLSRARGVGVSDGGVAGRRWQQVGDEDLDDRDGGNGFADDRSGGGNDGGSAGESPPTGSEEEDEDDARRRTRRRRGRRRVVDANVAAFFGEDEPSPRAAPPSPAGDDRGDRGGGYTIVRAALEAFFRGRGGGDAPRGGGRRGGAVRRAAAPAEYELAPVEPAAEVASVGGIRNADVV